MCLCSAEKSSTAVPNGAVSVERVGEILANKSGKYSLPYRFRALFGLRNVATDEAVEAIAGAFSDQSALLKHELAYVLGQIQRPSALPHLVKVLEDMQEDPMVRHEAAEAMGAIGKLESLCVLEKYREDSSRAVAETCQIAIDNILRNHHGQDKETAVEGTIYGSVDPAPPMKQGRSVDELRQQLMDCSLSLYERYKAMFALRNRGTEESVLALCAGLGEPHSALFRHEIAYVLGQLQHPASVPALAHSLSKIDEAPMVRHEAAEALGSVATPEALDILRQYLHDPVDVVRESCEVALDIGEFEKSAEMDLIAAGC